MRSKTGIPPRLASTRDVAGKYANSPYPQWMKTLEDKYQKLHTKIMQTTSVSSLRPVNGPRMRRTEASVSRLSNRTRKTPTVRGSVCQSGSDIGVGEQGAGRGGDTKEGVKTEDEVVKENEVHMDKGNVLKDVPDVKLWREGSNLVRSADHSLKPEVNRQSSAGATPKANCDLGEGNKSAEDGTNGAVSLDYLPTPRNVTTSISRTSHKTSRSCPAVIQTPRDFLQSSNPRETDMDRSRRPTRRKNLKLFSRMSMEAQHAVSETLIEMGAENSSLQPEASFVTQLTSNAGQVINGQDKDLTRDRLSPTEVQEESFSSAKSCASSRTSDLTDPRDRRALDLRGDKCMFPEITPRSSLLPKSTSIETMNKTEELRIPGVGKYNIMSYRRERTFQITFGDFDIRYRDIISCDRRGSETPPSEIREKAIAKCLEWLEKYTPR